MLTAGIVVFVIGLLWAILKGYVVWDIAHDVFNGGGAPTLDFPVICPIPLAFGASLILGALGRQPFPGFGMVAYLCLAVIFSFILWLFHRLGTPTRERKLQELEQKKSEAFTVMVKARGEGLEYRDRDGAFLFELSWANGGHRLHSYACRDEARPRHLSDEQRQRIIPRIVAHLQRRGDAHVEVLSERPPQPLRSVDDILQERLSRSQSDPSQSL